MPELPEVESFKRHIDSTSLGKVMEEVVILSERTIRPVPIPTLVSRVRGRKFLRTFRHGKNLFVGTDTKDTWIHLHFGMTGRPIFVPEGEEYPRHARVLFRFAPGGALIFRDPRKFGKISLVQSPEDYIREHRLGPDPISSGCDLACFRGALTGKKGGAKAILMDQRIIAGIGNLYADEILFQACIHPLASIAGLGESDIERLYYTVKEILHTAVAYNAEYHLLPDSWIIHHRKIGEPCSCGGMVSRIKAAGRTTYFCPRCQKIHVHSREDADFVKGKPGTVFR
jgi:formamidopyrimidine-DNA glycosylase